ncbi:hypothetical protein THARTR1_07163 [Trichoderma harzianum]|uniref:Protein kinase domain-containing protein n=1 Tax=Trichoderma harzianum TaxID=5544 RepID=A0A2K0U2F0_TRIHA|nr:hypothetical protein THARTR1_07163 [Trichoderma harzianum]
MTADSIIASNDPPIDPYETEDQLPIRTPTIFLHDDFVGGRLRFRGDDYNQPKLRQSTLDPNSLVILSRLGGGTDGYVWKVRFGDQGPFALKVFWDQAPPQDERACYPMQRECQNAAVIHMMEASLASEPVLVYERPFGDHDVSQNYFAFCEENSMSRLGLSANPKDRPAGAKLITEMPRLARCYGWVKFPSDVLEALPFTLRPTHANPQRVTDLVGSHTDCTAIVYEFIEAGRNTMKEVMKIDNFLWYGGFAWAHEPQAKSWRNSVLVDYSEVVHNRGHGWTIENYMEKSAESIISDEDLLEMVLAE